MSYATIFALRRNDDGEYLDEVGRFGNSLWGALALWDRFARKMFQAQSILFLPAEKQRAIWLQTENDELDARLRLAMAFTLDFAWCPLEFRRELAASCRFVHDALCCRVTREELRYAGNNHWKLYAECIDGVSDAQAVCLNATSSGPTWYDLPLLGYGPEEEVYGAVEEARKRGLDCTPYALLVRARLESK